MPAREQQFATLPHPLKITGSLGAQRTHPPAAPLPGSLRPGSLPGSLCPSPRFGRAALRRSRRGQGRLHLLCDPSGEGAILPPLPARGDQAPGTPPASASCPDHGSSSCPAHGGEATLTHISLGSLFIACRSLGPGELSHPEEQPWGPGTGLARTRGIWDTSAGRGGEGDAAQA